MSGTSVTLGIEHVFVLMLENRAFDHLLGFSEINGTDAVTGGPTTLDRLKGDEANDFKGKAYPVTPGADLIMPTDPAHEFLDVLHQFCGPAAGYQSGGAYPTVDHSGFVASYVTGGGKDPAEVMKCYRPEQLPVLNALAREFVICDNWRASMPGPTWPNRIFVHAASSGGLDHSPRTAEIAAWELFDGFPLPNGTIFDRLTQAGIPRRLYAGDPFPVVSALKGIQLSDIRSYGDFADDVAQANYPDRYIFIEPSYDVLHDYKAGTSQHPLGDITRGEGLIKATYEAIRNSPIWPKSMLIITWDEHGGFYDHAGLPPAPAPGDAGPGTAHNQYGFTFEQYGPRVPGLVISPLIPKNLIDHRLYDHSSIPATLESLYGLRPLTARDAQANHLDSLITLKTARTDAPTTLPAPIGAGAVQPSLVGSAAAMDSATRPDDSVDDGNLPGVVQAAMRQDIAMFPEQREAIVARVSAMETREDAMLYLSEVQKKIQVFQQR
jgi:phospholipase C